MVECSTISLPSDSPISSLLHHLRQRGTVEIHIREPSGGTIALTAAGCVARIQAFHASLVRTADAHASSMLEIGWLLLQVRTNFPRGAWLPWLRSIGLHGKRAQEWMRIASEFANSDGSPDLVKACAVGVLGDNGRMLVHATKLRSIVRELRMERRASTGAKMPGKADDLDDVLGLRLGEDDEDSCEDLFDEDSAAPIDDATRAARVAALKAGLTRPSVTDDETDMLPDPVGGHSHARTHIARVGEVPSAGDSGTHAPVQNPGVASAGEPAGPGETERTMVQTTPTSRGASGEQTTFEMYVADIFRERDEALTEIEAIVAEVHSGAVNAAAGRAAMQAIRVAAQMARRGAAA